MAYLPNFQSTPYVSPDLLRQIAASPYASAFNVDPTQTGSTGGALSGQAAPGGALSGSGGWQDRAMQFLDPQVALPIAAQLMGGKNLQQSLAGGLQAAGAAIPGMKQRAALNAYMKSKSGKALTPEEQQMLQADPELGRAYLAQQLTPKPPTWGVIGKDSSGAEQYGWIYASSQTVTPLASPGGAGSGHIFGGTGVEASALNWLVDNGKLTQNQAAQLAASKQVTGADGTIYLATPEGIFGKPSGGGPAVPVGQDGSAAKDGGAAPAGMIPIGKGKTTETAARAAGLYAKAAPDYQKAVEHFDALNSTVNQGLDYLGMPGRVFQSSEYKVARNAAKSVVASYQYAASGASAPEEEVQRNLSLVLPDPSDDAATIADKKARLSAMMQAMQIVAQGGQIPPEMVKQIGIDVAGPGVAPGAAAAPAGAPAGASASGAPVKITGDADYNALPSGAHFIGPDGHERVKP